jgi:hypothetical protein
MNLSETDDESSCRAKKNDHLLLQNLGALNCRIALNTMSGCNSL